MTTDTAYYNAEAADKADESVSFSFGRNWKKFLSRFDEQTLARAQQSFVQFNHIDRLDNYDFLDIGSGSGLSSLVAVQLGARRVVSVDIDPFSIECTQKLRERFEVPEENWEVRSGSALDPEFMESLGRFRYVHSWGVLHHTGAMWEALANVVRYNVDAHGLLHLALYNKHRTSKRWLAIKRFCNRSPRIGYPLVKWAYIAALFSKLAARGVWPMAHVREYRRDRGMDFYRDIEDWLLGLPYEFASPDEMVDYFSDRELHLLRLRTTPSCGCNEFLFCKPA
jgi:2-polyprenyl-6-hydroxyphenyl methylase/3-demethylubiquinone-9 3-methyltransferase